MSPACTFDILGMINISKYNICWTKLIFNFNKVMSAHLIDICKTTCVSPGNEYFLKMQGFRHPVLLSMSSNPFHIRSRYISFWVLKKNTKFAWKALFYTWTAGWWSKEEYFDCSKCQTLSCIQSRWTRFPYKAH